VDPESQVREVLLKDKFLTVSPWYLWKTQSMTKGKRSLDQLIQLAISVYYNRDITNREKDEIWPHFCPHPTGVYISSLLPWWTGGALLQRILKGTARETALPPTRTLPSLQR
jgi:hypothetical protein